jgi:hypothetical protein
VKADQVTLRSINDLPVDYSPRLVGMFVGIIIRTKILRENRYRGLAGTSAPDS